jgi:DNA-binding protein HU-beta
MEKRRKQMRKQDLIDAVSAKSNLPKRQVAMVIDATFNAIRDAMAEGQKVTMTGFGSFEVAQRNEREGQPAHRREDQDRRPPRAAIPRRLRA